MNNVIVLGKVITKSSIHFDYFDKLKVHFVIYISEKNNVFKVIVSENHMELCNMDKLYKNININSKVCVCGTLVNDEDKYMIVGKDIYKI